MLGKEKAKVINHVDISNDKLRSLITFYLPLLGAEPIALYEYFLFSEHSPEYREISETLNILGISIDSFEESLGKLNQYHLIKTFQKKEEGLWILELHSPLSRYAFVKSDLYVRNFILKAGGSRYQEILSTIREDDKEHRGFEDVSKKMDLSVLEKWSPEDEAFLSGERKPVSGFSTLFDVNYFLRDMSDFLFPLKYRTYENLHEIAMLGDLYGISYDKMRTYIARVVRSDVDGFDLRELRRMCQASQSEYREVEEGDYNTPNLRFLMSLQGGKEATVYDRKILYNLANDYKLPTPVINVLLENALAVCDNRLIERYLYPIASDLHRNGVTTAEEALDRLDRGRGKRKEEPESLPAYDPSGNPDFDEKRFEELMNRRKQNG